MPKSVSFMSITDKVLKKGQMINFEGEMCKITSINIVEPFAGGKIRVYGWCRQITKKP